MKRLLLVLALVGCGEAVPAPLPPTPPLPSASAPAPPVLPYPASRRVDASDTLHGVKVADPYRWLEDASSQEVKTWMTAQDTLARSELAKLPEREALAKRFKELYYTESIALPTRRAGRFFVPKREATAEKWVITWRDGKAGEPKVLLDPNGWSADGSLSLGAWSPSWDGKKVAYSVTKNNSDEATLYLLDVATGKKSDVDVIEGARYAHASWTPKGDGFYYTWLPTDPAISEADRPGYQEIRFHSLGTSPKNDALVHGKTGDPSVAIGAEITRDGHWLTYTLSHGWASDELFFRDVRTAAGSKGDWRPLTTGTKAHFNLLEYRDRFYVYTDDGAPHWHVFAVDPAHPERAAWKQIVPERADATLDGADILGGKLVLTYLKDASSRLEVHDLDGKLVREVALPGLGTVSGPTGQPDDDEAYYLYHSFAVPPEIRAMSIKTGASELVAKKRIPVDPTPFTVEQVFFPSKDGTRLSMFVVHRKDLVKDGSSRALLYGYGGFLRSETPSFSGWFYPWLEHGGVYAVANLRGGGEYGEAWHKAGMLLQKQNVFDDFAAAAEYLLHERYTAPDRLAISGGSNGGLLVGAAIVQRPDLFSAALCDVPLLDMVRYHLFGAGKTWISEYGSADDPEEFKALYAYSPYHHVEPRRYPAVLLLSADSDDRVDPMHARKFAAALQASSKDEPVLLRIEKNAGHGGADLIRAAVEKGADAFAFLLAHTASSRAAPN